jgi:indole-3-glycerol phosphate synthase
LLEVRASAQAHIDYGKVPDVLKEILRRKEAEVAQLKAQVAEKGAVHPLQRRLEAAAAGLQPQSRLFSSAIRKPKGSISVIAEIKRRSPSAGVIAEIPDVRQFSDLYYNGGAAAISVLTDAAFDGTMEDLDIVVKHQQKFKGRFPGPCPVLRKDFIVDEIQIAEAAEYGAAAVLLIVAALGEAGLRKLVDATHRHGLEALVEIHDEEELEIAKAAGAEIIGTNARDLRTFQVDLERCFHLIERYPPQAIAVAESGIKDVMDAWRLRDAGYSSILVGETLIRAAVGSKVSTNAYQSNFNEAYGLLKAFTSKGSTKFGPLSTTRTYGKGEGAKESLGYLEM